MVDRHRGRNKISRTALAILQRPLKPTMHAEPMLTMNGPAYLGSPEGEKVPCQVDLST